MKVELLVNLITSNGLLEKGKIFTDPLPGDIWDEINSKKPTVNILIDDREGSQKKEVINEAPPKPFILIRRSKNDGT